MKEISNFVLQFFPTYYTLSECLNLIRVFFPVGLTLIITGLDFTLDKPDDNADDPLSILRSVKTKQDKFFQETKDLAVILRAIEPKVEGDGKEEFWKTEPSKVLKVRIGVLQKEINEFAENELCKLS